MRDDSGNRNEAPVAVSHAEFMERLAHELDNLSGTTISLQVGLNSHMLAESDSRARKALQSLDTLTQSLQCLTSAVQEASGTPSLPDHSIPNDALSGVFLEDLRHRLRTGHRLETTEAAARPGQLDLF